ncbi:MAG TPA: YciI family protein, partial [Candidatus Dormibacteraeota bacterium]|nr:YciI family protein [Candidatus Dormibacteraeota bacterium]
MEMQAQYFVAFFQTRYASLAEVSEKAPDELAAHIARSKKWNEQGRLLMAGAFLDQPEEPVSTMVVLASREDAEEYVAGDPFVVNGMVASSEIR